ncbi:MAG: MOSC domain-containing protein [Chloroflexota bacterium]
MNGTVSAVNVSANHAFRKASQLSIRLIAGEGVEGDAHRGTNVQHLFLARKGPNQPNLRQVHLIHSELHAELRELGFEIAPGQMGENITTRGLEILSLPEGARLHLGDTAVVELTGLRSPCVQLDRFQPGLKSAVLTHDAQGELVRKAGVMGIVLKGGEIIPGDPIRVELPNKPHQPLRPI